MAIGSFPVAMKTRKPRVCVIDGLGGGIGSVIIKRLKELYQEEIEVIALGINVLATAQMLKARANQGATGENAIIVTAPTADVIIGTISIVLANAMLGEVTPQIATAIGSAPAYKILLPLTQECLEVVGVSREPLPHLVEMAVANRLAEVLKTLCPSVLPVGAGQPEPD